MVRPGSVGLLKTTNQDVHTVALRPDCVLVFLSDQEEPDMGYKPVHYRKVFLDDEAERDRGSSETSLSRRDGEDDRGHRSDGDDHGSEDSYHYSDDHEDYSEDSEHDADTTQPQAGE